MGANLLKMDSTINVNAVCEGIRDMFRGNPRLSAADAETFYLSYVNYALPEKARAYEEQFLLDIAKSNRSYARTSSGVTYTVTDVGDQNQVPTSERDSVALRWVIRTAAGDEITSSYERGDINIPVEALIKLADLYDVSLDYLVGRSKDPKRR